MSWGSLVDQVAAGAPDPEDARRRAERFCEAASSAGVEMPTGGDAVRVLTLSCQRAPYLATLLARDPTRLGRVASDPYLHREKPAAAITSLVDAAVEAHGLLPGLRRARADEMVRMGVRELELGLDTEVGRELSRLADAAFDAALRAHDRAGHRAFCVIGMGKLGGEELNFASDVDVIYVHATSELDEYWAKVAASVTAALSEVTADDVVFRVDLRLRPEGSRGAIATSLPQLERYYEAFGRPWERQAWLKARPCAGDLALGEEVMEMMRPFVYPRRTAPTIVDEVRALNVRIKQELTSPRRFGGGYDVKNGEGGIREIEFFVQALQLIHAGRNAGLRARGTLLALDQLLFAGLVGDDEHLALYRAYRWLRHVEHLLQLEDGRQTQTVPADRTVLARRLGYADAPAFEADLAKHTGEVARLFATLGAEVPPSAAYLALADGALQPEAEREVLKTMGFADLERAARELEILRRRAGTPIGPALLEEIAGSADPDLALGHVVDLAAKRGAPAVWRLCAEQPAVLRLLVSIFGASEYLSRQLVERPELLDLFVNPSGVAPRPADDPDDEELAWSAIAEAKNLAVLRVGLADFAGALDPLEVCAELTAIAEATLAAAFDLVQRRMTERYGPPPARMAVLGLGKLGGRELGYAADLDVIFVYDGDDVEYMTRLAQRLVTGLHARTPRGRLYEVDARLRPSGSQGLLVSSLAGWTRYHEGDARLWERQALIKLRAVAGDPMLGLQVASHAADVVWGRAPGDIRAIAAEVSSMRDRMEKELGSPGDLKVGRGGIIDVEFAAQFVQLAHGHAVPALRTPSTAEALRAAAAAGIADAGRLALLEDGYRFLRRIEHRMRVVHDQPVHRLPADPRELEQLARRAGFPSGAVLADRTARWKKDIRSAYEEVLLVGL